MATDTETTNPYTDNGYSSRADYLAQLCDEYPADVVHTLADLLGETEDFDGLVTMLEDHQVNDDEDIYIDDATDAVKTVAAAIAARDAARAGAHAQTVQEAFDAAYISTPARDAAAVRAARDALAESYADARAAILDARAPLEAVTRSDGYPEAEADGAEALARAAAAIARAAAIAPTIRTRAAAAQQYDAAAVRTARENLTGAYLEADAALNAALDALKDARAVYAAASAALDAAD